MVAGLHSGEIAAELGINGSVAKMLMDEILHELGAYEGATRPIPSKRRRRPRPTEGPELLVKLHHQIRMSWGLDPAGVARELERQARSQARLEKYAEEWRRSHPEPPQPVSATQGQADLTPQETEVLGLLSEGLSKNPAQDWANLAVAELGCAAASQLRNHLTREDLRAASELIVEQLARENPLVAGYLTIALDQVAQIARAVIRDSEILYKRDALRNALIDAGCEDPLRPPALS